MNFKLVSEELCNFRLVRTGKIEPLLDGMTALNGPVGAGKSSFVTGLLFALYGVSPKNVPVKGLRRQGSAGEPCFVRVVFQHEGQTIEVVRGFEGIKDDTNAILSVNGVQVSKSSKGVTAWITRRFGGMDAKAFETAFVIKQKELEELVQARPEIRRATIERLAGIDRMSDALAAARDEATEAKRALDLMPGSAEELRAAVTALDEAQNAAVDAHEAAGEAQSAAQRAADTARESARVAADLRERAAEAAQARAAADRAGDAADAAERDAARLAADADRLAAAAEGGDPAQVAAARDAADRSAAALAALSGLVAAVERERGTVEREQTRARTAQVRARAAEERAAEAEAAAAEAARLHGEALREAAEAGDPQQAQEQAQEAAAREGAAHGDVRRLRASLAALGATAAPSCPTCAAELSDPAALKKSLAGELAAADRAAEQAGRDKDAAQRRADTAARATQAALRAAENTKTAAARAAAALDDAVDAERDALQATETAAGTTDSFDRLVDEVRSATAGEPALRAEKTQAQEALQRAQRAADALAALPAARDAAAAAATQARDARGAAETAVSAAAALAVDPAEVAAAGSRADADADEARVRSVAAETAVGDARVCAERAATAETERDRAKNRLQARADAFARHERLTFVAEGLAAFRRDRVARLAPELSEIATDLMVVLSDGEYVAVELDENFTAYVTDAAGETRPVSYVSGGEEGQAAIAIRLALREVVVGNGGGFLWADEPFTSQDVGKRTAAMSAFRDLPNLQVLMINHATEAADMVDRVYHVRKDLHRGSTVSTSPLADVDETGGLDDADGFAFTVGAEQTPAA